MVVGAAQHRAGERIILLAVVADDLGGIEMGTGARRRFVPPSLRSTGRQRCAHRHRLATGPDGGIVSRSTRAQTALLLAGLRLLDPETAHRLTIWGLAKGLAPAAPLAPDPRLKSRLFGLDFAHPVGLAAGFDKDAEVPEALTAIGFSFVEVGTLTPQPQAGNPRPRVFRLPADGAVINRYGFNNQGLAAAKARLAGRPRGNGILGINVGANKTSTAPVEDYSRGITRWRPWPITQQ